MRQFLIVFLLLVMGGYGLGDEARKLTKVEYEKESTRALVELQEHPAKIVAEAKAFLAETFELPPTSPNLKIFDADATFTVNTMLFALALKNGIKKDKTYVENFRLQARSMSEFIADREQTFFLGSFVARFVWQNDHLPDK